MKRALLLLFSLHLAGCAENDMADLRDFMAKAGQGSMQKIDPLPVVQAQIDLAYDPTGLPDPFQPRSLKTSKSGGIQPDLNRPKGPLEQEPIDAMRMVGTLTRDGRLYALVRRGDGTLYRVAKGDHIGHNFGVILEVNESGMDIKEIVQDGGGDWIESKANMALQE